MKNGIQNPGQTYGAWYKELEDELVGQDLNLNDVSFTRLSTMFTEYTAPEAADILVAEAGLVWVEVEDERNAPCQ